MLNYSATSNGRSHKAESQPWKDFRGSVIDLERVMSNSSDVESSVSPDLETIVLKQDEKGKLTLWGITQLESDEFTMREIRQEAGLSDTEARNRVNKYIADGVLEYKELPTSSPKARPTYIYRVASGIDKEKLKSILDSQVSGIKEALKKGNTSKKVKPKTTPKSQKPSQLSPPSNKAATQMLYRELLGLAFEDGITITEAAKAIGRKKSTIHSQLEKWRMKLHFLDREEGQSQSGQKEFVYFFAPNVTREQLEKLDIFDSQQKPFVSLTSSETSTTALEIEPSELKDKEVPVQVEPDLAKVPSQASSKLDSNASKSHFSTRRQLLLEKFPAFDSSWNKEMQEQWFTSFERLERLMKLAEEDS